MGGGEEFCPEVYVKKIYALSEKEQKIYHTH